MSKRLRRYHDPQGSVLVAFLLLSTVMSAYLGWWLIAAMGASALVLTVQALIEHDRRWRDTSEGGER